MKDLYDFIKSFDMHTIIVVGIAFWFIQGSIKEVDQKVNNLSERVARIEGILITKDFCAVSKELNE